MKFWGLIMIKYKIYKIKYNKKLMILNNLFKISKKN
jgi:hypothetical protein